MRRFNSATLFAVAAAAAEIYGKRYLRSVPTCDSSHRSDLSAAAGISESYERKRLPSELSALPHVTELSCESAASGGVCQVYLLGVRHGSQESIEEVKAMIEFLKPQVVFLEACENRVIREEVGDDYVLKEEEEEEEHENDREGRQGELYAAGRKAFKYDAKIVLGDRPLDITVDRFSIMEHSWQRLVSNIKVIHLFIKGFFVKKDRFPDLIEEIARELGSRAPSYYETMINERDQYMSAKLLEAARQCNSVVAVVGKAHLPGIQKHWEQPIDMEKLLQRPTRTKMVSYMRYIYIRHVLRVGHGH